MLYSTQLPSVKKFTLYTIQHYMQHSTTQLLQLLTGQTIQHCIELNCTVYTTNTTNDSINLFGSKVPEKQPQGTGVGPERQKTKYHL